MKNIRIELSSLSPFMSDCFRGQEELPPERKLYLSSKDKTSVILPASNIMGFLASQSSRSCVKAFVPTKEYKRVAAEILAAVYVAPTEIPFTSEGKPVVFSGWNDQIRLDERMARPSTTARVLARRPVLAEPWGLEFDLTLAETKFLTAARIKDWFEQGGLVVGIGAYRPMFGRFEVKEWKET